MTVIFLWRTVWEPFLEDSTSHRFMHPVEWRGGFHDMELFGKSKRAWLQTFLALPNGVPSHDTFGRLFACLNPQRFQECFLSWPRASRTSRKVPWSPWTAKW